MVTEKKKRRKGYKVERFNNEDWQHDNTVAIVIVDDENKPEYICSFCSRRLVKLTDSGGKNESFFCNNCCIESIPEMHEMRKKSNWLHLTEKATQQRH